MSKLYVCATQAVQERAVQQQLFWTSCEIAMAGLDLAAFGIDTKPWHAVDAADNQH